MIMMCCLVPRQPAVAHFVMITVRISNLPRFGDASCSQQNLCTLSNDAGRKKHICRSKLLPGTRCIGSLTETHVAFRPCLFTSIRWCVTAQLDCPGGRHLPRSVTAGFWRMGRCAPVRSDVLDVQTQWCTPADSVARSTCYPCRTAR